MVLVYNTLVPKFRKRAKDTKTKGTNDYRLVSWTSTSTYHVSAHCALKSLFCSLRSELSPKWAHCSYQFENERKAILPFLVNACSLVPKKNRKLVSSKRFWRLFQQFAVQCAWTTADKQERQNAELHCPKSRMECFQSPWKYDCEVTLLRKRARAEV